LEAACSRGLKEDRVDGHIFISVLAYHLLCWVRRKLEPLGDMRNGITLRHLLGIHSLTTISLPLVDGRIIAFPLRSGCL